MNTHLRTPETIGEKYGIALSRMIDRIEWVMQDVFYPEGPAPCTLRRMILEFEMEHGTDAVISLFGFIRYIQTSDKTKEEQERALKQGLSHDINGRYDKYMLPRSSGYIEFAHK